MNKKIAIIIGCIAAALIVIGGGVFFWRTQQEKRSQELAAAAKEQQAETVEEETKDEQPDTVQHEEEAKPEAVEEPESVPVTEVTEPEAEEETQDDIAAKAEERAAARAEGTTLTGGGHIVCIDPGHQAHGNSEQEEIGPGAGTTKPKVSSGTYGPASGLNEYELNLAVALKLRDELTNRGYQVVMTRETHDVNISNHERADIAAAAGAEILVRIHANGDDNSSVSGTLTMAPGNDNPYLSSDIIAKSNTLSRMVVDSFCAATGAKNLGVQQYNNMSGINWAQMPVTIVEMGFMTNSSDDLNMADDAYQNQMVQGISNGIDQYFAQ
jgi:N-acetylmuramoyl-L-alanine amidase